MRRRTALVGGVAVIGSLVSCGRGRAGADGADRADGAERADRADGAQTQPLPPAPVNEALWVADGSGTLRAYDGRVNRVTAQVQLGLTAPRVPPWVTAGGGLVWAYAMDGQIRVVDPVRARVTGRAAVPAAHPPAAVNPMHAHDALWIAHAAGLWRVTPSGQVSAIPLPSGLRPSGAAATPQGLWLSGGGGELVRVDPRSLIATAGPRLPARAVLTGGTTALYAVPNNKPTVWLLDPGTAAVRSTVDMPRGELVFAVLEAGAGQWLVGENGTVAKVSGGSVTRQTRVSDTSQDFPSALALGSLWLCDQVSSTLIRVELSSGEVSARIPVDAADPDDPAFAVVGGEQSVWIVDTSLAEGVLRVDPVTNRAVRLAVGPIGTGITAVVAAPPTTGR